MPAATPSAVRKQIAAGQPDPVYLIIGDDEAATSNLAADLTALVEDELRAFNTERLYANEKSVTPAAIVEAARTLPMLGDRRVVVVLRAERILKPKRRGKTEEEELAADSEDAQPQVPSDALEAYLRQPEPQTTLVFVAADADRSRRLYKALQKTATIVECWGLKAGKEGRTDLREAARIAEQMVRQAVTNAGQQIEPAAARLVAQRAGADITTLRGDIERLLLFAAGKPRIDLGDVQQVVSAETAQDDWAVTNAIERGNAAEALKQLALTLDAGAVPYKVLGQLAWVVRDRLSKADPHRVPHAVDALFRTDQELKSSVGDPRVLLERLVVELCRR